MRGGAIEIELMTNIKNYVHISSVDVFDDKVFTRDKAIVWKDHMLSSAEKVLNALFAKIDHTSEMTYFVSKSLVDEVSVDAIIGMRKIVKSNTHEVDDPNAFKIAAYLGYWWLRHKPVSIIYSKASSLEEVQILGEHCVREDEQELYELERQKTIWRLKHINELIAVEMVTSYIFDFDNVLCDEKDCKRLKKKSANADFPSFDQMMLTIMQKLTYYFAYRAIAPKVIEHILEGYTFHPAWGLTGSYWNSISENV